MGHHPWSHLRARTIVRRALHEAAAPQPFANLDRYSRQELAALDSLLSGKPARDELLGRRFEPMVSGLSRADASRLLQRVRSMLAVD